MKILGIETSCDETAIAVAVDKKHLLSNIIVSSLHLHKRYGGVVPEIACRHHTELINIILDKALKKAKVSLGDIDAVSVTRGPGLVGSLLVGISLAKALSYSLKIPIIAINHLHAHLYSPFMNEDEVKLPAVGLIVSGGHSSLVYIKDIEKIELLGQTRDDACGEAFDKVAKILDLGFPGGPVIEKTARKGNPEKIEFPRTYLKKGSLDFSFSGIKTAVLYYVDGLKKKKERVNIPDVCAGFQAACFDMLLKKTEDAIIRKRPKSIVIGGGVSANSLLRQRLKGLADSLGVDIFFPPKGMHTDNAGMVAALGAYLYQRGKATRENFSAEAGLNFN